MKNLIILAFFCSFSQLLLAQNYRSNCPVKEETFIYENPDKTTLTVTITGTEMIQYAYTTLGQTVLKRSDGFYEFGNKNEIGDLVGSGIIARDGNIHLQKSFAGTLRYSDSQINQISAEFYKINPENKKKAGGKPFPSKGKRNVLALLIQYPDLQATIPKGNFDSLLVKPNYNGTGSFRDYYLKSSFGQLDLNVDVFGWFNANSGFLNYGKSNPNYMQNVGNLVKRAVLAADSAGVDFTKYDNDSDGYVDGIILLHAGIGAEEQSAPSANNFIWSHRYNLTYTVGSVLVDGVLVDAYGCFPEKRYNGGSNSQVGIGVISHEFGHLLDLPDLYSTNSKGEGTGNFANMGGGPWLNNERTPCFHDAWSRLNMGWVEPISINAIGNYTIPKSLADSNFIFKISTPISNEYFLLENRQKKGFDFFLPSKGLAIWHINSNKAKLLSYISNSVNTDTSSYGVGLEQSDGKFDLEKGVNRGDAGDLYPSTLTNRNFGLNTTPNSSLHYKVGGVKQPSFVSITNITQNADSSISFTVGNKPTASFDAIPPNGCAPLYVDFNNVSSFADNFLWKFHDGTFSKGKNQGKMFDSAGNYSVTLFVLDSLNNPIDSSQKTIIVSDSPKAKFSLLRSDSNTFSFKNESTNALYVVWRFGSNQSSTNPNPTYTISGFGDVPYMLIAFSQNQCSDTATGTMNFWPLGLKKIEDETKIQVYPNPFHSNFTLDIWLQSDQNVRFKLYDVLGNLVWSSKQQKFNMGKNTIEFDNLQMAKGIYLFEASGQNFNKTLRISAQ